MRAVSCRKELSEDLRPRIANLHKAGKGYKVVLSLDKQCAVEDTLGLGRASLPRSGRHVKVCPRSQQRLIHGWLLELANTGVHESTVNEQAVFMAGHWKGSCWRGRGTANRRANVILMISMVEETSWCEPAWAWPAGNH